MGACECRIWYVGRTSIPFLKDACIKPKGVRMFKAESGRIWAGEGYDIRWLVHDGCQESAAVQGTPPEREQPMSMGGVTKAI